MPAAFSQAYHLRHQHDWPPGGQEGHQPACQLFLSHEHGVTRSAPAAYNGSTWCFSSPDPQSNDLDADLKYITTLCDQCLSLRHQCGLAGFSSTAWSGGPGLARYHQPKDQALYRVTGRFPVDTPFGVVLVEQNHRPDGAELPAHTAPRQKRLGWRSAPATGGRRNGLTSGPGDGCGPLPHQTEGQRADSI